MYKLFLFTWRSKKKYTHISKFVGYLYKWILFTCIGKKKIGLVMSLRHSDFFTYISEKVILSSFLKFSRFLCSNRILNCVPFTDVFTNHLSVISWTMKIPFVCYFQNTAHLQSPKEQFLKALRKYVRSLCNQFLCWTNEMKHWTLIKKFEQTWEKSLKAWFYISKLEDFCWIVRKIYLYK